MVDNSSSFTWAQANATCRASNGHLLSLESLAETVALNFYLTGFFYTSNYWIDMVNTPSNGYVWSWTRYAYEDFGYLKKTLSGLPYAYLRLNASSGYEIQENSGTATMGYICEEIGK